MTNIGSRVDVAIGNERLTHLRTNYVDDPLGLADPRPVLSWQWHGNDPQVTFRICVASAPDLLAREAADRWVTPPLALDECTGVRYAGASLRSRDGGWWHVHAITPAGEAETSKPATFEVGLLQPADWTGTWIGGPAGVGAPLFRREFDLSPDIIDGSRAYVCGLGYHEVWVNGERVGDHCLAPAPTTYTQLDDLRDAWGRPTEFAQPQLPYLVYDLTGRLHPGRNCVGVQLAHGWYSAESNVAGSPYGRTPHGDSPTLLAQIEVPQQHGGPVIIATSDEWRTTASPIHYNDYCHGEHYDARAEQTGWSRPGFPDDTWHAPAIADPPRGTLRGQLIQPSRVIQEVEPTSLRPLGTGRWLADFGQHVSGWTRVAAQGPAGTTLTVRHAGALATDGELDGRANMMPRSQAAQTDVYTMAGAGRETWSPRFTLHGFQFVEVSSSDPGLDLESVRAQVVHNDVAQVGTFECEHDLLNRIHQNVTWTLRASLQGLPQDAADRAERLGWLGDPGWVIDEYMYNFDTQAFWRKWLVDIRDCQLDDGSVPIVCPAFWRAELPADVLPFASHLPYVRWPDFSAATYITIAWSLYQFYGDRHVLEDHFRSLCRALRWMESRSTGDLLSEGFGDHMEPQPDGSCATMAQRTPAPMLASAWYFHSARSLQSAAELLRDDEALEWLTPLTGRIRDAFNRTYLDPDTGVYASGSQTAQAVPLWLGLVPPEHLDVVADALRRVIARDGTRLTTGTMGTAALEHALPAIGSASLMFDLATGTEFPSWGHQISQGATTVWETWGGEPDRSRNMKLLAAVDAFLYRDVAGIAPAAPGWSRIAINPSVTDRLRWARAAVETPRGRAAVSWMRERDATHITISVPPGCVADVCLSSSQPPLELAAGQHALTLHGADALT